MILMMILMVLGGKISRDYFFLFLLNIELQNIKLKIKQERLKVAYSVIYVDINNVWQRSGLNGRDQGWWVLELLYANVKKCVFGNFINYYTPFVLRLGDSSYHHHKDPSSFSEKIWTKWQKQKWKFHLLVYERISRLFDW